MNLVCVCVCFYVYAHKFGYHQYEYETVFWGICGFKFTMYSYYTENRVQRWVFDGIQIWRKYVLKHLVLFSRKVENLKYDYIRHTFDASDDFILFLTEASHLLSIWAILASIYKTMKYLLCKMCQFWRALELETLNEQLRTRCWNKKTTANKLLWNKF